MFHWNWVCIKCVCVCVCVCACCVHACVRVCVCVRLCVKPLRTVSGEKFPSISVPLIYRISISSHTGKRKDTRSLCIPLSVISSSIEFQVYSLQD